MYTYKEATTIIENTRNFVDGVTSTSKEIQEICDINIVNMLRSINNITNPEDVPMDELCKKVDTCYYVYFPIPDGNFSLECSVQVGLQSITARIQGLGTRTGLYTPETAEFMLNINKQYVEYSQVTGIEMHAHSNISGCLIIDILVIPTLVSRRLWKDTTETFKFLGEIFYNEAYALFRALWLNKDSDIYEDGNTNKIRVNSQELTAEYQKYSIIGDAMRIFSLMEN